MAENPHHHRRRAAPEGSESTWQLGLGAIRTHSSNAWIPRGEIKKVAGPDRRRVGPVQILSPRARMIGATELQLNFLPTRSSSGAWKRGFWFRDESASVLTVLSP